MDWVEDALAQFGRQIGIERLEVGEHGAAQLAFDDGGLLAIEPVSRGDVDEVLVYLGRPVGHGAAQAIRVALQRARFTGQESWVVQAGIRGSGSDTLLLALVRLPRRTFTPQALSQAVDHLARWLDDLQPARN